MQHSAFSMHKTIRYEYSISMLTLLTVLVYHSQSQIPNSYLPTIFKWVQWIPWIRFLCWFSIYKSRQSIFLCWNINTETHSLSVGCDQTMLSIVEQWTSRKISIVSVHRYFIFSFISIIIISYFRLFSIIIAFKIDNNNNRIKSKPIDTQTHKH